MPESVDIGEITQIKKELKESDFGVNFLTPAKTYEIVKRYDKDLVGKGSETVVFAERDRSAKSGFLGIGKKPFRQDVVVAVDYKTVYDPIAAKEIFYRQRIMATLFPDNFPHFATSLGSTDSKDGVSLTIRQRVKGGVGLPGTRITDDPNNPFGTVLKTMDELHLPVDIDTSTKHYAKDRNGNVYYLDKVDLKRDKMGHPENNSIWNKDSIRQYMTDRGYSNLDKRIVEMSIDRLNSLKEEKSG
jgi:hypothetical protein